VNSESIKCVEAISGFSSPPESWYCIGHISELEKRPLAFSLPGGGQFVAYRTQSGRPVVLARRCCHFGADLSKGTISGENLCCPLHGWEYNPAGTCVRIPAAAKIPHFARQMSYPVEERAGHVFFFNRPNPAFPLPFFEGINPDQLLAAPAFEFIVDVPWHMVGANGFDVQHFRCAHDRTLLGEPIVDSPHPFAWRLQADFQVGGNSFYDHLTRFASGPKVTMTVTNWCGNLVLVSARFRRTTSYGIVSFIPLADDKTLIRDIVLVPRSRTSIARCILDPVDSWLRKWFIREFVRSDVERSQGIRFNPQRAIEADQVLVDYFSWLNNIQVKPKQTL
jgi:phenylpropionate dioxygenase-like ring-hydroxylating dioxygenase large terminal subunit